MFGTSPPYLKLCQDRDFHPGPLPALRSILSTGSILYDRQFDWVANNVKRVPLQSISGGTDIIGCFVLGSPNLPVYRGTAQCRSLGLDVQAMGAPPGQPGELSAATRFRHGRSVSGATPTASDSTPPISARTPASGRMAISSPSPRKAPRGCSADPTA